MAKDKGGGPILTVDDWKTGKDRNKEHLKHVAELERKRAWRTVLLLGLLVIVVWAVVYWTPTGKEGGSTPSTAMKTIFGVAIGLSMLYATYTANTCPKCKQRWATKETGERKGRGVWIFFEGEVEWKCKYCGDRHWTEVKHESGGAG